MLYLAISLLFIILFAQQIIALVFCVIIGNEKNRSGILYGLFLGLLGLLILAILPPVKKVGSSNQRRMAHNEKKCKSCGSVITDDYRRCPNCGSGEFYDNNAYALNTSDIGAANIPAREDFIVCPFCKERIKPDVPTNEFKKMNCPKCNQIITSKNVLFE